MRASRLNGRFCTLIPFRLLDGRFGTLITDVEVLAMQLMSRLADHHVSAQDLVCPSCAQVLCNPILLPCGHRFCLKCVSASSYFKKGYKCPVCLKEHTLDLDSVRYGSMLNSYCPSPSLASMSWCPPPPAPAVAAGPDARDGCRPAATAGRAGGRSASPSRNAGTVRCEAARCDEFAQPVGGAAAGRERGAGSKGLQRAEAERAIEDSILRMAAVPDLSQAALSMSPDSVDGFALIESDSERRARARHSVAGIAVRAVAGALQVPWQALGALAKT